MSYRRRPFEWGFDIEAKGTTPPLFNQVHGNTIIEISDPAAQRAAPVDADGGYSFQRGMEISVFTADCFPLLFFSPGSGAYAAVHCGWRGALKGIPTAAIRAMNLKGNDYELVMGPALLGCCFEVKEDFIAEFRQAGKNIDPYLETRDGKIYCHHDRYVLEEELKDFRPAKLHAENKVCTHCSPTWPSNRRNKGTDPRIRTWIVRR